MCQLKLSRKINFNVAIVGFGSEVLGNRLNQIKAVLFITPNAEVTGMPTVIVAPRNIPRSIAVHAFGNPGHWNRISCFIFPSANPPCLNDGLPGNGSYDGSWVTGHYDANSDHVLEGLKPNFSNSLPAP